MSLVPFTFKNVELKVVTINSRPWTRAKEVCKALEYGENTKPKDVLKKHVSIKNKQHQHQLKGWIAAAQPLNWPKNSQPSEYYLNEEGMYELNASNIVVDIKGICWLKQLYNKIFIPE